MRIGFIGLGHMGAAMAANLLRAGHEVTVFNRSREKAEPLLRQGAHQAERIADACHGDAVVTMLADDRAVHHVSFGDEEHLGGIVDVLDPGAVHISSSTISLDLANRLTHAHADHGQKFVSAPVFGRPEAAAAAGLYIVVAGAPDAVAAAMPVLDAIGQRTFVVSEDPPAANIVKLAGNFLIASAIESLGEAMALVAKAGVDKALYLNVLTSTLFGAPVYQAYGRIIADEAYHPAGFAAPLGLKDIGLALKAGEELQVPLPVASLLRDRLLGLLAAGGADLDWSAIATLASRDSGADLHITPRSPSAPKTGASSPDISGPRRSP
ncbi:MAG: NAD(P)-dependent oxidoreductase [Mycobacterium sp.]